MPKWDFENKGVGYQWYPLDLPLTLQQPVQNLISDNVIIL